MGISSKKVKGTRYIYHYYYDPDTKRKREVYCGSENNPESKIRAYEYEKEWLSNQIRNMESELISIEKKSLGMQQD